MSRHRLTIAAAAATLLAAIALYSVVAGSTWFWESAGAVVLVALAGTGTRAARRVIPAVACLAAALAVLLLYLNILFAGPRSGARVIPTGASLYDLWRLAGRGLAETSRFAPPVPPRPGVLLLTVAGIGIIAALTDLLAVRLRRPALAGLPLLALFCVPETTSSKPGAAGTALVFILAMAGYLGLLAADGRERVRLWGRLVSAWQSGRPYTRLDTSQLAASGRRVGMAAVVLALLVPLLVPSLRPHRLFGGSSLGGSGGGRGGPV
ncbi:MAG: transglutaminase domain-containing protein, partial [Actinobacteria bacterium]|nr:transglutaminase domain-containing protein [Actinomycetota bacterium]